MFVTRTLNRTVKGKRYYTHRLVGSETVNGRKRRRVILYLGASFPIPEKDWKLLCKITSEVLAGQSPNWFDPPDIVREAHYLAKRIRAKASQNVTKYDDKAV